MSQPLATLFGNDRPLVLWGCGKMGQALLRGWLDNGLEAGHVWVVEPHASGALDELAAKGVKVNLPLPNNPLAIVLAVKPQVMRSVLFEIIPVLGQQTLVMTIAAGLSLDRYQEVLGNNVHIIRAMPNTPSAVGKGVSAIIGNKVVNSSDLALAEVLLSAVGDVVHLDSESQMDAVTAISGSGPAYVFYLIEALAAAGIAQGLSDDLAMKLARATVIGAGALAHNATHESVEQLRVNVTSPGGTTAAALSVLMDEIQGLGPLIDRAVKEAAYCSRKLGKL